MENRISSVAMAEVTRESGPQPIGRILADLLLQYQARFPELQVTLVETSAAAL